MSEESIILKINFEWNSKMINGKAAFPSGLVSTVEARIKIITDLIN